MWSPSPTAPACAQRFPFPREFEGLVEECVECRAPRFIPAAAGGLTRVQEGFDFVVVGAGTAGCVLAARLSEDARNRVCLVEAGGSGKSVYVNVPGAIVLAQRSPELVWRYQTVPQSHLNGRRIGVPRGRGLGGSALINGMVY